MENLSKKELIFSINKLDNKMKIISKPHKMWKRKREAFVKLVYSEA